MTPTGPSRRIRTTLRTAAPLVAAILVLGGIFWPLWAHPHWTLQTIAVITGYVLNLVCTWYEKRYP